MCFSILISPEGVFVYEDGVRGNQFLAVLVPQDPPDPGVGLDQALHDHLSALPNVGGVDSVGYLHVDDGQVVNVQHPGHVGGGLFWAQGSIFCLFE